MEGNSDVSSPPTFETQTIGGVGSAAAAINRMPPFFSQAPTHSRAVWLMYLAKVLEVDLQIFNWRRKSLQQWVSMRTIQLR